jgi:hypothetical protein
MVMNAEYAVNYKEAVVVYSRGADSLNFSSDYFAYLRISARETALHQKRMPIAN